MKLEIIKYSKYEENLPQKGNHILTQQKENSLILYQAYNSKIADFAIKHQKFGGSNFKYSRMSWVKPNFLWMMYRSGWAKKENQERILAIEISKSNFDKILFESVNSTYLPDIYGNQENWKDKLAKSEVRIQWDPDHDYNGEKLERRAIQLGLRGEILEKFGREWILSIEDITNFVHKQKANIESSLEELEVIKETEYFVSSEIIRKKLNL